MEALEPRRWLERQEVAERLRRIADRYFRGRGVADADLREELAADAHLRAWQLAGSARIQKGLGAWFVASVCRTIFREWRQQEEAAYESQHPLPSPHPGSLLASHKVDLLQRWGASDPESRAFIEDIARAYDFRHWNRTRDTPSAFRRKLERGKLSATDDLLTNVAFQTALGRPPGPASREERTQLVEFSKKLGLVTDRDMRDLLTHLVFRLHYLRFGTLPLPSNTRLLRVLAYLFALSGAKRGNLMAMAGDHARVSRFVFTRLCSPQIPEHTLNGPVTPEQAERARWDLLRFWASTPGSGGKYAVALVPGVGRPTRPDRPGRPGRH